VWFKNKNDQGATHAAFAEIGILITTLTLVITVVSICVYLHSSFSSHIESILDSDANSSAPEPQATELSHYLSHLHEKSAPAQSWLSHALS